MPGQCSYAQFCWCTIDDDCAFGLLLLPARRDLLVPEHLRLSNLSSELVIAMAAATDVRTAIKARH